MPRLRVLDLSEKSNKCLRNIANGQKAKSIRLSMRRYPIIRYPIAYHAFDSPLDTSIAERIMQNLHDALYLALAVSLKGFMVTADRRFHEAVGHDPARKNLMWISDIPVATQGN